VTHEEWILQPGADVPSEKRAFIEEALVATVPKEGELLCVGMSTTNLLELAVAHEMAHVSMQ